MKKFSVLLAALAMTGLGSMAQAGHCHHVENPTILNFLTSTTLPPLTTTTLIVCAITDSAEVNKAMIQKEATMVNEENKIFVPSFLGSYADQNNMEIRAAAKDVLANGVR